MGGRGDEAKGQINSADGYILGLPVILVTVKMARREDFYEGHKTAKNKKWTNVCVALGGR